ncbi:hypothetical protein BDV95DRAFT_605683 [Massariosphaeria phaeospora]|uniref:Pyrrolo-quinoline quinone n=1 Tax=Massariosphaeria phaeospora TaxID=100035 RepID=A0A7C8I868_9PLEO|nr:hypothetical protein BDV95DRAFT_605683 [Massariosphaeria phaeospora]
MEIWTRIQSLLLLASAFLFCATLAAPSDSPRDADAGQSGYVGGDHNVDPATASQFQHLWNASFLPDEKHWARPLVHTLKSSGRQIVFTASTENYVRTFDAVTGEKINERQILPPWPMGAAYCTAQVSQNLGIMGTPIIDVENEVVYLYVKSYNEDIRIPGGASPPLNAQYYFYVIYIETLWDLYYFPLLIDDIPADNDPRKIFMGGLVLQRPALTQIGSVVYAGFGGLCDAFNYTGAIVTVDMSTKYINVWVTQGGPASPWTADWSAWHGGGAAGIWQAGLGLSSDGKDVYFNIDNGAGSTEVNGSTTPVSGKTHIDGLSETAVRVTFNQSTGVQLLDWFRPYDWQTDAGQDIGSGGVGILDPTVFTTDAVKRLAVITSSNPRMYVQDLDNLGGYRQGANGTDGVLQTIPLAGEVFGGIGSYPHEGGYIYVNPGNTGLQAYKFTPSANASALFSFAGKASNSNALWGGAGVPTVTSRNGEAGSGVVWITDPNRGLLAYRAVPQNGSLVEIKLPKVEGAGKFSRPVFGDGRVYVIDGQGRLVALGVK